MNRPIEINPDSEPVTVDGDTERINAFIETRNKGLFGQLSDAGKEIMSNAYEGIYMTPVVNRLVGKMEIAYNQFWIDRKEKKAGKLKDKMDVLDLKNESINNAREEIEDAAQTLEDLGLGGSSNMLLKSKKLEDSVTKNENKLDKLQGRIENRENQVKLFTNKRDAIADRLINHYEKKLSPIEGKLGVLEDRKNEVELFCISQEVKLEEKRAVIKTLEDKRAKVEKAYMSAGYSNGAIKRGSLLKELNNQISDIYSFIQVEQAKVALRRDEINKKITKVNRKAEPYRNRKNEFIRVKNNRPVDFGLKERKYADEFKSTETAEGHTREPGADVYYDQGYDDGASSHRQREPIFSSAFEGMEDLTDLMYRYQEFLQDEKIDGLAIDVREFIGATRFSASSKLNVENFKKVIAQFYKAKKIEKSKYENIINNFK